MLVVERDIERGRSRVRCIEREREREREKERLGVNRGSDMQ